MTATGARSVVPAEPLEAPVERFKAELDRLWPERGRLALAVSGGPDSLAMLLLAEAAIPGQFEVATVDHGLRAESAGECATVAALCADRNIPCEVLPVEVGEGNIQDRARTARYAALADWAGERGLTGIATAHHADDQAETLLMRLNRGSGLAGLAGVREQGMALGVEHSVPIIRPLLRFRRAELAEIVEQAGLVAAQDPSNEDERYDRARIRKALADNDWLDPLALSASAAHLAEANDVVEWSALQTWFENVAHTEGEIRYRPSELRTVNFKVVKWAIRALGKEVRGQDVARMLDRLKGGKEASGNLGGVLVTSEEGSWIFRPEPPRRTG
jgi:tRNA(Ile)-lysidine synthase